MFMSRGESPSAAMLRAPSEVTPVTTTVAPALAASLAWLGERLEVSSHDGTIRRLHGMRVP